MTEEEDDGSNQHQSSYVTSSNASGGPAGRYPPGVYPPGATAWGLGGTAVPSAPGEDGCARRWSSLDTLLPRRVSFFWEASAPRDAALVFRHVVLRDVALVVIDSARRELSNGGHIDSGEEKGGGGRRGGLRSENERDALVEHPVKF